MRCGRLRRWGLYAANYLTLTNTQFMSNTSYGNGGGAYAGAFARLSGDLFQNNYRANDGLPDSNTATVTITITKFKVYLPLVRR